jgi:hypothetical protein
MSSGSKWIYFVQISFLMWNVHTPSRPGARFFTGKETVELASYILFSLSFLNVNFHVCLIMYRTC